MKHLKNSLTFTVCEPLHIRNPADRALHYHTADLLTLQLKSSQQSHSNGSLNLLLLYDRASKFKLLTLLCLMK
jgi:hypothetical protein